MRANKYEIWARTGYVKPKETMDEKYRKKAKKRLFSGKKKRPCHYCGAELSYKRATLDHLTPRSKGGKNIGNLKLACRKCNQEKGAMTDDQYRAFLLEQRP